MESFTQLIKQVEPMQFVYGGVAILGGIARYMNSFTSGGAFSLKVLVASTFVSGFSGWMFATMGISLSFPQPIIFMMAGTGGFFGDQTMKLILEYIQGRIAK